MPLLLDTDQIETIREICDIGTTVAEMDELTGKLTNLGAPQQSALETYIKQWNAIKFGTVRVNSVLKGTKYDINQDRDLITYRTRRMLGYPATLTTAISEGEFGAFTINLPGWSSPVSDEHSAE